MLSVTEEGQHTSEELWHKPRKDEKEMAFLAAVDIIDEYPVSDAYALANQLPFVHGIEAKTRIVRQWMEEGLITQGQRF